MMMVNNNNNNNTPFFYYYAGTKERKKERSLVLGLFLRMWWSQKRLKGSLSLWSCTM
tara:strand:+ start:909 stop:1079 length:171 start_codon:yes stop_codon:yes gene_type:complete